MSRLAKPLLFMTLLALAAGQARAAGDPVRGGDVFDAECGDCHSLKPGKVRKGPSLFGVVGRAMATQPGYNYSDALRRLHGVWTPGQLDAYLHAPKAVVPGGRMKYDGLGYPAARADVIAFLSTIK